MTIAAQATQAAQMPPHHPLAFPVQAFDKPHSGAANPHADPVTVPRVIWARVAVFAPAGAITGLLMMVFLKWFAQGGLSWVEGLLAGLIGFGMFWIALSFATAVLGAVSLRNHTPLAKTGDALDVALLMPIYNEAPHLTFGNAGAMMEALGIPRAHGHTFTLYMLSDTREPEIAACEEVAFTHLRASLPRGVEVFYRRRGHNTDRKVGNLADWVTRWGGAHDAMLVLDADSLMSAPAIRALTDALASDPGAGLIQSFPHLIGARTLFARAQEFANSTYGAALAKGLALWTGQEGNYWGHNAIIRTTAFAASAGLPKLRSGRLILSHDFVEAGLMRRAGWGIRFLPQVGGSWEETPPALLDHVARDIRWCQGNLQHLRLLRARGFHGLSRFHLLHGAVGYLLSPLWFALLIIWALIGTSEEQSVLAYFSSDMPLRPTWPEMGTQGHVSAMLSVYSLLIAPKLIGAATTLSQRRGVLRVGGVGAFLFGLITEVLLSILYAPILMVQQTRAVAQTVMGVSVDWIPQARDGGDYATCDLIRAHWLETVIGTALLTGIIAGLVSAWLLPIGVSLAAAVGLSWLSGQPTHHRILATPQSLRAPAIRRAALRWQDGVQQAVQRAFIPGE